MTRAWVWLARLALLAGEVLLIQQYVDRGTAWHGLIHSFAGFGAGLTVAALLSATSGRPAHGLGFAVAGQVVSVAPDVLYITNNLPHRRWMDVFLGHISVHTAWAPLLLTLGFFLVASFGWWLAAGLGLRRSGSALALLGAGVFLLAHLRAAPIPEQLGDVPPTGSRTAFAVASASVSGRTGLLCRS